MASIRSIQACTVFYLLGQASWGVLPGIHRVWTVRLHLWESDYYGHEVIYQNRDVLKALRIYCFCSLMMPKQPSGGLLGPSCHFCLCLLWGPICKRERGSCCRHKPPSATQCYRFCWAHQFSAHIWLQGSIWRQAGHLRLLCARSCFLEG